MEYIFYYKAHTKNGCLIIDDRRVILETDYASIAQSFLGDTKQYKKIDITFVTPTSFKVNQAYEIFPNIERIMRSFLKNGMLSVLQMYMMTKSYFKLCVITYM